jgi:hypothetical protein
MKLIIAAASKAWAQSPKTKAAWLLSARSKDCFRRPTIAKAYKF